MNQQEADAFVQRLYDSIFDSLTKAEPGGKPIFSPATTIFSLAKPGMVINAADFRNPWTPGNLNGSQDAALHTADLVDDALKLASVYTQSGNSISSIYGEIMDNVQIPVQAPNPAIEKQLADAHAVLYRTINRTDSETGEVETVQAESQVYRDYQDNQSNYFTARAAWLKERDRLIGWTEDLKHQKSELTQRELALHERMTTPAANANASAPPVPSGAGSREYSIAMPFQVRPSAASTCSPR